MLHVHTLKQDVTLTPHDSKAVQFIRAVAVCPALVQPKNFVHTCIRRVTMHLLDSAILCYVATTCITLTVSLLFVKD